MRRPFAASFAASEAFCGTGSPHAAAERARRVGRPFSSFIGPLGLVKNLVRKEPLRRIFVGVSAGPLTPGFKFEPSVRLKCARPAAVSPPFGSRSIEPFSAISEDESCLWISWSSDLIEIVAVSWFAPCNTGLTS